MPQHNFVCEFCAWETTQPAPAVWHSCRKNDGKSTDLIDVDKNPPVDIICDGCDAEWLGKEHVAYTDPVAFRKATADGWSHSKKGDFCPRCVAESKVPV